jgi:hypothetical protein
MQARDRRKVALPDFAIALIGVGGVASTGFLFQESLRTIV